MATKAKFNYIRPKLYSKQEEAFFNDSRFSIILGSTKSGKSVGAIAWLFEQAIMEHKPTGSYWWLAPTYSQAQIMYRRLKAYIPEQIYTPNDSEMRITLINGNNILFKTAERLDNLYGEDVHALVLDEASRCRPEVWNLIVSVTTATKGKVRLVGNVRGKNYFWNLYSKHKDAPSDRYSTHSLTVWDAISAGVVEREEIEDIRQSLPVSVFSELYENIPTDSGNNPFDLVAIEKNTRPLSTLEPVCWGWDLAKSTDWTVGIALDQHGQVCQFHRFQKPWEQTVQDILNHTGDAPALIDATGVGDPIFEQLSKGRSNYEAFKFSQTSKQQLMELLALGISTGEVRFPEGIIKTELEAFEYVYTRTGVRYSAPAGMHDDAVVSLALAYKKFKRPINNYLLDMLDEL